jgi:O-antigen/teichoic acid export membrane protein
MNESGKRIAKNATVLMASQLITWGMALLLTFFLPRYLGATGFGKFQLAISLWAIVSVFVNFGMDTYLVKEVARKPEDLNNLFSTSTYIRILLFTIGTLAMILYIQLVDYPGETNLIILIIGVSAFFNQLAGTTRAMLNGLEDLTVVSVSDILTKGTNTILAIILLLLGLQVTTIALVAIVSAVVGFTFQFYKLARANNIQLQRFNFSQCRIMLRESIPYLFMNGFLVLYMQVDIVVISLLVSERALGWYGTADRLFSTLLFIPGIYIAAVFPALSRTHTKEKTTNGKLFKFSFNLVLLTAVPIGLGLIIIAEPIILLLFGSDFIGSIPILMVFGVVLIITYLNMIVGIFLISMDKQRQWTMVIVFATLASIPLDLVLIPQFEQFINNGAVGGAVAFVITEFFMLMIGLRLLPQGVLGKENFSYGFRVVVAGAIMFLVAWQLRSFFILVPIISGALIFLICIIVFKLITPEIRSLLGYVIERVKQKTENIIPSLNPAHKS